MNNNPPTSNLPQIATRYTYAAPCILLVLMLGLPSLARAQFRYVINYGGTVTITGYTGSDNNVTIPRMINGLPVTAIAGGVFSGSLSLNSVMIPDTVTNLGNLPFYFCTGLRTITVDAANPTYSSADGVLFNKDLTTLLECPGFKGGIYASYAVPDSVTNIGSGAFSYCWNLTGVTIGDRVTRIGGAAFEHCSFTNVSIPNSVTTIGDGAFRYCTSLESVTLPNGLTSIGDNLFHNCGSLANVIIPDSVTNIGNEAFALCSGLTSVAIPKSVTSIGNKAFYACIGLSSITVEPLNSDYSSVDGVLFNKSLTALIQCPGRKAGSYAVPNSATSIGDAAFAMCRGLTSVTIPNSVTSIGGGAFETCSSLTNVTIPNGVTHIASVTFVNCYALTDVIIPNSVTGIWDNAFSSCSSLTSITIPGSVNSIGVQAFILCTSLTNVTIANGVTNIGDFAFGSCTNLAGVYFEGNAPTAKPTVFDRDNNVIIYYLPGTTGWGLAFGGRPTALWPPPTIQRSSQTQTAEAGSVVGFGVKASSSLPLSYLWYFNGTNLISCSTNSELELSHVQFSQAGVYTAVITDAAGSVTSSPAMLSVIAPVERCPVPGINVIGEMGSLVNVDSASSLNPAPNWAPFGSVKLTSTSQYYFDLTQPLPPRRFFRAWQTGTPSVIPSLDLHMVPAITLTGSIGDSVRVDSINRFGPTDAWVTLDTVTLTNTSQLYFDVSSIGQPPRLWRIVTMP